MNCCLTASIWNQLADGQLTFSHTDSRSAGFLFWSHKGHDSPGSLAWSHKDPGYKGQPAAFHKDHDKDYSLYVLPRSRLLSDRHRSCHI